MLQMVIDPNIRGRFEITLADGRTIWMTSLVQWPTYSGLLGGHPGPSVNSLTLRLVKDEVGSRLGGNFPVALIQPETYLYEFPVIGGEGTVSCEVLPAFICGALFDSASLGGNEYASSLVITWFQDEWGMPTPTIREQIAALSWEELAIDWTPS